MPSFRLHARYRPYRATAITGTNVWYANRAPERLVSALTAIDAAPVSLLVILAIDLVLIVIMGRRLIGSRTEIVLVGLGVVAVGAAAEGESVDLLWLAAIGASVMVVVAFVRLMGRSHPREDNGE